MRKIISLSSVVAASLLLIGLTGCGGGGGGGGDTTSTTDNNTVVNPYTQSYTVSVIDDAVIGTKVTAVGCTGATQDLGGGSYKLTACADRPTVIVADGGFMDTNGNGVRDDSDVPMGLPLILDTRQSGGGDLIVSPLSTLAATAKDDNELETLAQRLGLTKEDLFKDLSTDPAKKEILQLVNAQFIAAQEHGVLNAPAFVETLKEKIIESGANDAKTALQEAVKALAKDPAAATLFGSIGFSGFVTEAKAIDPNDLASFFDKQKVAEDKVVFVGFVYDEILPEANVTMSVNGKVVGSFRADTAGRFRMEIDTATLMSDAVVLFTAEIDYKGDHVKLVSSTTTAILRNLAKARISPSDFIDLVISNVTTAEYVLAKKRAGTTPTPETFAKALSEVPLKYGDTLRKTAALIKSYVDDNATNTGGSDTLTYVEGKIGTDLTITLTNDEKDKVDEYAPKVERDPVLSKQLNAFGSLTTTTLKALVDAGKTRFYGIDANTQYDPATGRQTIEREYKRIDLTYTALRYREYEYAGATWQLDQDDETPGYFDTQGAFYFTDPKEEPIMIKVLATHTYHNDYLNKDYTFYELGIGLYKPYDAAFYLNIPNLPWADVFDLDPSLTGWSDLENAIAAADPATGYEIAGFDLLPDGKMLDASRYEGWEHFTVEGREFLRIKEIGNEDYIVALNCMTHKAYRASVFDESTIGTFIDRELLTESFDLVTAYGYVDDTRLLQWAQKYGYTDIDEALPQIIEELITTTDLGSGSSTAPALQSLLTGKEVYLVSVYDGHKELDDINFSADGTSLQWQILTTTQSNPDTNGTGALRFEDSKIVWVNEDPGTYAYASKIESDHIFFEDYDKYVYDGYSVLFYDYASAKAYYDSLPDYNVPVPFTTHMLTTMSPLYEWEQIPDGSGNVAENIYAKNSFTDTTVSRTQVVCDANNTNCHVDGPFTIPYHIDTQGRLVVDRGSDIMYVTLGNVGYGTPWGVEVALDTDKDGNIDVHDELNDLGIFREWSYELPHYWPQAAQDGLR